MSDHPFGPRVRPIAIPTVEQEGYRALVRRRKRIAESRGKIKQKIKNFLPTSGIEEPASLQKWPLAASIDLSELPIPPEHCMTLASMVREYLFLLAEDKMLRAKIRTATMRMHPDRFRRLTSIIGVGETAAAHFLAELFSPERFNRSEDVTSYPGLAPVVSQSGDSPARAKLRPVGQKRLRGILVEAAWQWPWRDPEAKVICSHHFAKHGIGQKALVAVARKLAIKLWRMTVDPPLLPVVGVARVLVGITDSKKRRHPHHRRVPKTVLGDPAFRQARIRKGLRKAGGQCWYDFNLAAQPASGLGSGAYLTMSAVRTNPPFARVAVACATSTRACGTPIAALQPTSPERPFDSAMKAGYQTALL
ncbi:transposase [Ruegeria sp. 2012CJ41-6]|uniref:Transposase n=1 Tax=Ruegeria spongiae TaxID=2942209 RepID=A0ABT0PXV5_9RHOB|nr:transposase [Ruegeria spongiae]MCL6282192.1 transposase [Ruegeria spongiae]